MWYHNNILTEYFIFVFFMNCSIKILFYLMTFVFAFRVYTECVYICICIYIYRNNIYPWYYLKKCLHSFLQFWGYFCFLHPSSTPYWDSTMYTGCDFFCYIFIVMLSQRYSSIFLNTFQHNSYSVILLHRKHWRL